MQASGLIRVEQGKGLNDRYTVLPETVLRELENFWRLCRPRGPWLFPSSGHPDQPMANGTPEDLLRGGGVRGSAR